MRRQSGTTTATRSSGPDEPLPRAVPVPGAPGVGARWLGRVDAEDGRRLVASWRVGGHTGGTAASAQLQGRCLQAGRPASRVHHSAAVAPDVLLRLAERSPWGQAGSPAAQQRWPGSLLQQRRRRRSSTARHQRARRTGLPHPDERARRPRASAARLPCPRAAARPFTCILPSAGTQGRSAAANGGRQRRHLRWRLVGVLGGASVLRRWMDAGVTRGGVAWPPIARGAPQRPQDVRHGGEAPAGRPWAGARRRRRPCAHLARLTQCYPH